MERSLKHAKLSYYEEIKQREFPFKFFHKIIVLTEELSHFQTLKLICIKMVNAII